LQVEKEWLKVKHTVNFNEGKKIYNALQSVSWFLIDCVNDDEKWHEARKACGWSGDDSHDLPVEDPPIGGIIENWEIAEIVDNECCIISRDGSANPFWVPFGFLQCVGVRFDLPRGCDQK